MIGTLADKYNHHGKDSSLKEWFGKFAEEL